eukprot:m.49813 g.49813  ORF g.49813 m.49813 type:complete len:117 (+) comp6497_c0_seq1:242-592(+)
MQRGLGERGAGKEGSELCMSLPVSFPRAPQPPQQCCAAALCASCATEPFVPLQRRAVVVGRCPSSSVVVAGLGRPPLPLAAPPALPWQQRLQLQAMQTMQTMQTAQSACLRHSCNC